ncbi:hypothetical protein Tco_1020043 [Tanacetum coccineum]|uniref:Uncharacterized protein n=1 Tax=Tanacetum coccineum TaxID=301880 RepID=A0ABQ5FYX0_9ASTR
MAIRLKCIAIGDIYYEVKSSHFKDEQQSCQLIPQLPILLFTLRHDHGVSHLRILTRRLPDSLYILEPEHPDDLVPAEDEAPIEAYITKVDFAPRPPLTPPSFLPLLIRPLRTRAAMAQMRAAAPSTYQLLLPSGTPPLLPIPLPALSTSRRADIPKADTSPRKRLLLTAPRPRYEVGESSATARQPGPTIASRVDYSFVNTVETRVRDTERRMIASDEELEAPIEDQLLPTDASPTTLSPGYIADFNSEEDEEDPEDDPADYPTDGGDNDDNESSDDDNDDDVEKEWKDEEEEHLAPTDPSAVPTDDPVP